MGFVVHHGDCREVMASMDAESVDAVVCDPPYGLSFMGKGWDHGVPGFEFWAEAIRVAKPGAHLLAFGGTRTYHRLACAIEDAGWEIRDCVMWVYGSGFPKSHDVSKAIDKVRSEDAEPVRVICRVIRAAMDALGLKSRNLVKHFDGCHPRLIDHWAARDTDSQPALPTWDQWQRLRELLAIDGQYDAEVWRLNGRKGQPGDAWQNAEVVGEYDGATPGFGEHRFRVRYAKIREASLQAAQWSGWGTALKPAWEPIIVARKPLCGTVAENVLRHGTGGINVDGCRVAGAKHTQATSHAGGQHGRYGNLPARGPQVDDGLGRWPANVIHDGSDEVVGLFPGNAGASAPVRGNEQSTTGQNGILGHFNRVPGQFHADSGSAARFFYCAKASKADRDEGCEGLDERENASQNYGTKGVNLTRKDGGENRVLPRRNNHPTVKPTALMRYLCRLVTPPGGVVLDPFTGSGSTGKAAILEGFRFIGIEREAEYVEIARARIAAVATDRPLLEATA